MTGRPEPSGDTGELKEHCEGEDMWLSIGVPDLLDDAGDGLLKDAPDMCFFFCRAIARLAFFTNMAFSTSSVRLRSFSTIISSVTCSHWR